MSDLAAMTGATLPFGDEFESKLSPLTLQELGELESWMQRQPFEQLSRVSLSPIDRQIVVAEAARQAADITIATYAGERLLRSAAGVAVWLLLSMRAKVPGITIDDCKRMVTMQNLPAVQKTLLNINGMLSETAKTEDGQGNAPRPPGAA